VFVSEAAQLLVSPGGPTVFREQIGAEARIELVDWYGCQAIRKIRIQKDYRLEELDSRLRYRRTKEEVRILHEVKRAGVSSPLVYFADPISAEIVMEYIPGIVLKDLSLKFDQAKSRNERSGHLHIFFQLGQSVARMHSIDIIHGDLTTKNVIISPDLKNVSIVDFGLSYVSSRVEDRAEDIHLMKQALTSTLTPGSARICYENFLAGYKSGTSAKFFEKIGKQIAEIERRGRYAVVD
jgi:Kae1-associated kinase Bud32